MDEHALKMLDTAGRDVERQKRLRQHQTGRLIRIVRAVLRREKAAEAALMEKMREDE